MANSIKKRIWQRKKYMENLNNGLCPCCGKKRTDGWIVCKPCRDIRNAVSANTPAEKRQQYLKTYRTKNKKNGLCPRCSKEIIDKKYTTCPECREYAKLWMRDNGYRYIALKNTLPKESYTTAP